jgi:SAM-dependent methyltransferase
MGTAAIQGKMWGARAEDWAIYGEAVSVPLFERVLNETGIGKGTMFLDIGCGGGTMCEMAFERGASVHGIDASESLISFARKRIPQGVFQCADMEELPYGDSIFDVISGINSFQFAGNIVNALKESKRVAKKGGTVAVIIWDKPEYCQAAPFMAAMSKFLPPPPPRPADKPMLYTESYLESLAAEAGLKPGVVEQIDTVWNLENDDIYLRSMLSSGLATLAIEQAGEQVVREAALTSLKSLKKTDGSYSIRNRFRLLISEA